MALACCVCSLLQAAIALDAHNPLARFELAGVLMAQERLEEALRELQQLAVSCVLLYIMHGCWLHAVDCHSY